MSDCLLSIDGITRRFGGLIALDKVSLSLSRGEILAIIGPNGSGKTTFFNVISGHYLPDEGEILFAGRKMNGLRPDQFVSAGIARTFQTIRLFPDMSVIENVMVGMHCRTRAGLFASITGMDTKEEEYIRTQAVAVLAEFGDYLLPCANESASSLSYANQRRLEICRALVSGPRLLLLDEPAAGMNPRESEELMDFIRKLPERGVSVMIIEHDMPVIRGVSDRVIVLNQGKIIARGDYDEVSSDPAVIEAYLGSDLLEEKDV